MGTATILRLIAVALGGVALLAVLLDLSGDLTGAADSDPAAIWEVDRAELDRCRDLGLAAAGDDPGCAALWDDMRDRFLGRDDATAGTD